MLSHPGMLRSPVSNPADITSRTPADSADLELRLGYKFRDKRLLHSALGYSVDGVPTWEHLETVGDGVIGACVKNELSIRHPKWTPHQLTQAGIRYLRNADESHVHGSALYRVAKDLKLETYLALEITAARARGKSSGSNKTREHQLVDRMEAVVGAILRDCGKMDSCRKVVENLFKPMGLLTQDMHSDPGFGASAGGSTHGGSGGTELEAGAGAGVGASSGAAGTGDEDVLKELRTKGTIADEFVEMAQSGRRDLLEKELAKFSSLSSKDVLRGLTAAILEKHTGDVALICSKFIDNLTEEDLLDAINMEPPAPILGTLEKALKRKTNSVNSRPVPAAPSGNLAADFVELAKAGNEARLEGLLSEWKKLSSDNVLKGLVAAVTNNKMNIIPPIIKKLGHKLTRAQVEAAYDKAVVPSIKGYLKTFLDKMPAASPAIITVERQASARASVPAHLRTTDLPVNAVEIRVEPPVGRLTSAAETSPISASTAQTPVKSLTSRLSLPTAGAGASGTAIQQQARSLDGPSETAGLVSPPGTEAGSIESVQRHQQHRGEVVAKLYGLLDDPEGNSQLVGELLFEEFIDGDLGADLLASIVDTLPPRHRSFYACKRTLSVLQLMEYADSNNIFKFNEVLISANLAAQDYGIVTQKLPSTGRYRDLVKRRHLHAILTETLDKGEVSEVQSCLLKHTYDKDFLRGLLPLARAVSPDVHEFLQRHITTHYDKTKATEFYNSKYAAVVSVASEVLRPTMASFLSAFPASVCATGSSVTLLSRRRVQTIDPLTGERTFVDSIKPPIPKPPSGGAS